AIADEFSESLNAAVAGTTSGVLASGQVALLGAGATSSDAIGVSMDTSMAGSRNGTVTIALESDGTGTSWLAPLALPSEVIAVSGNVYRLAIGEATPVVVNLGDRHLDTGAALQTVTVSNTALADGFADHRDAAVTGATGGILTSGAVSLLAAGAQSGAIEVGISTDTVGVQSGLVTIAFESNGSLTSGFLDNIAVGQQQVEVTGTVYRLAEGVVGVQALPTFVRQGDDATAQVFVTNIPDPFFTEFTENLNAEFGAVTGAITVNGGSVTGVAPGGFDNTAMSVSLDTATVGLKTGTATVLLESDGT